MITKEHFFEKYYKIFQEKLNQNAGSYCIDVSELTCYDCFYNGKPSCVTDLIKDFQIIIRKQKLEKLLK